MRRAFCAAVLALAGCVEQAPPALEPATVVSATPVDQEGENTGAGGAAGLVLGAAAGSAFGQGAGKALAIAAGAALGSAAGTAAESGSQTHDGIQYVLRMADGRIVTIRVHVAPGERVFGAGDAVCVETRGREQLVLPRP